MSKLIIVNDSTDVFTKSTCTCDFCFGTHKAVAEWETFVPQTHLQKRAKQAVLAIEERVYRRSPRLTALAGPKA